MALAYSNITVQLKEISLNNRLQELLDISPKGTVPVLCLNNCNVIEESLDIMKWALKHNDPESWITYRKNIQLAMIDECDNKFKHWLDRYKYYDRYPENNKNYYREKCGNYLSKLNVLLKDNRNLLSNDLLLVDVAIFPFIRQCFNIDKFWFQGTYVNLTQWLNNIFESKLFISVMDKYLEHNSSHRPLITNFT